MKTLLAFVISLNLLACSIQKGTLQYEGKKNEIIATDEIRNYMRDIGTPSIVLRVPTTEDDAIKSDPNDYVYNAIEKELLIGGFNVKDRGLFGEVMKRKSGSVNYLDIKDLTGADLILELVNIDTKIKHVTNTILTKNGVEKVYEGNSVTKFGALIEFKLILVKDNVFAGSYTFFYTPCLKEKNTGCECNIGYTSYNIFPEMNYCKIKEKAKDKKKKKRKEGADPEEAFEYIDRNVMEDFVRNGVRLMVKEITL